MSHSTFILGESAATQRERDGYLRRRSAAGRRRNQMARAVGIDLGTTNSVVSVLEAGEPVVIPNAEGSRTTPSVVGFSKNGEILVGEVAKRQAITNPDRTVRSVKRHMGDKDWTVDIDGKEWTPQEVSAQILLKLKRDAEAYLGDKVTQAVDHRAGVLRRRAAPGHQGGRPDRRPRGAADHQRADGGGARLRAGQGRDATRRSWCSTSAAARSTCRCWRSATACSRSRRPTATRSSAATTGTSGSSTGW